MPERGEPGESVSDGRGDERGEAAALTTTPAPPYYAVIFTSVLGDDTAGYEDMAARMVELASEQPGFLGVDSTRGAGCGITVSYWASTDAVAAWKHQVEHVAAQKAGRERWYRGYEIRVARVERAYGFRTQDT